MEDGDTMKKKMARTEIKDWREPGGSESGGF